MMPSCLRSETFHSSNSYGAPEAVIRAWPPGFTATSWRLPSGLPPPPAVITGLPVETLNVAMVLGESPMSKATKKLGLEAGLLAKPAQYARPPAWKAFGYTTTVGGFVEGSTLTSFTSQAAQFPVVVHSLLPAQMRSVGRIRPLTSGPLSLRSPVSIFSIAPAVLSTTYRVLPLSAIPKAPASFVMVLTIAPL